MIGWFNSIAASGHFANLGLLTFYQESKPNIFAIFQVQSIVDRGEYRELLGKQIAGHTEGLSGNPNDGDSMMVGFSPSGDKGQKGQKGQKGESGTNGTN